MPSGPTSGALLAQALAGGGGGGAVSLLGNVGPSDKYFESGASPADFASTMRATTSVPSDDRGASQGKGVNQPTDDVLNKVHREIKGDPNKVKVSSLVRRAFGKRAGKKHVLEEYMPAGQWGVDGQEALMPKDMTQDGVLKHPEYFFHSGFDEVSGSTSPSVADAATKHDQGPDAGADSYENYVQERDVKQALREAKINKKTAAFLRKLGTSPPATPGAGFDVPNDSMDLDTEPDLKRMVEGATAGGTGGKATPYSRYNRRSNLQKTPAALAKQAVAFSFGAGQGGYNSSSSSSSPTSSFQKQPSQKPPSSADPKSKKPRRTGMHAEFARTQTDPFQGPKIPQGFAADDPQARDAKTASLIRRTFGCL